MAIFLPDTSCMVAALLSWHEGSAPNQGIAGGGIYDAVIVACGLTARVDALLTFNERQLRPLATQTIQIVVPGSKDSTG